MSRHRSTWLAWSLLAFVVVLGIATAVMGGLAGQIDRSTIATFTVAGVVFLTFASVGAHRRVSPAGESDRLALPGHTDADDARERRGAYVELAVEQVASRGSRA